jgi:hypothetical protein
MTDPCATARNPERKRRPRLPEAVVTAARAAGVPPLRHLLNLIRDPKTDRAERDRLTAIAVQYLRGR